jgi:hypothetical protein
MISLLCILLVVLVNGSDLMRTMLLGSENGVNKKDTVIGVSCSSPGGHVSTLTNECECCPGYNGLGCGVRDKCYDVSCANSGTCDSNTGHCLCISGWGGVKCDVPSCNAPNGMYDDRIKKCVCKNGWAGVSCDQCAVSSGNNDWVCVPSKSPLLKGYVLMILPKNYVVQLLSGAAKPDPTISYNAIRPGSAGYNGKIFDCMCEPPVSTKRGASPANLALYSQVIYDAIDASTLNLAQQVEAASMWGQTVNLSNANLLTSANGWYITAIIFIILFILEIFVFILYCVISNKQKSELTLDEVQLTNSKFNYPPQKRTRPINHTLRP